MGMTMVRLATEDDLPEILDLANWAALNTAANFAVEPEPLEMWRASFDATHQTHPWLVARDDETDEFLGFAKASPWKGRCAYHWSAEVTVYVRPEHHRRGVGRALYTALLDLMRAQGFKSVLGGITLPNDPSVRLHETLGFRRVAVLEQVGFKFDAWRDVGYWQCVLNPSDDPPAALRPVREVADAALTREA